MTVRPDSPHFANSSTFKEALHDAGLYFQMDAGTGALPILHDDVRTIADRPDTALAFARDLALRARQLIHEAEAVIARGTPSWEGGGAARLARTALTSVIEETCRDAEAKADEAEYEASDSEGRSEPGVTIHVAGQPVTLTPADFEHGVTIIGDGGGGGRA
jgi:hypothetical protein